MKTIQLDAERLQNEADASEYMHELFNMPSHSEKSISAMEDCLRGYGEDTMILLSHDCVQKLCRNKYSFDVLRMIGRCVDANSHLHIQFDVKG